jgi:hypothetical protein
MNACHVSLGNLSLDSGKTIKRNGSKYQKSYTFRQRTHGSAIDQLNNVGSVGRAISTLHLKKAIGPFRKITFSLGNS